jgi:hypothetical protein
MSLLSCHLRWGYCSCREVTAMILNDVFQRFAHACPLPVMAQAVMENALNPSVVDGLFEDMAQRQDTPKNMKKTCRSASFVPVI